MELTIRDWMVIVGVLLIFAVLVDAWRRVRSERRSRVRLKLAEPLPEGEAREDISWLKELPNGGARVVERSELLRAAGQVADASEVHRAEEAQRATPAAVAQAPDPSPEPEPQPDPEQEEPLFTGLSSRDSEPENLDWLDNMPASERQRGAQDAKPPPGRLPRDVEPEVFMLNVVARNPQGFRGEDIMHILLACDLRFGDMNFFHRHEFEAGRGAIQFSVANMMQPGVFDIDNMADFSTTGLVFFVTLPGPDDMMKAFDYMLETAQAVARNLDGDVLDESRSVMTKQTLEHCRQQIRDLERRMLAKAP